MSTSKYAFNQCQTGELALGGIESMDELKADLSANAIPENLYLK